MCASEGLVGSEGPTHQAVLVVVGVLPPLAQGKADIGPLHAVSHAAGQRADERHGSPTGGLITNADQQTAGHRCPVSHSLLHHNKLRR